MRMPTHMDGNARHQTLVTRNAENPLGIASLAIFPVNAI